MIIDQPPAAPDPSEIPDEVFAKLLESAQEQAQQDALWESLRREACDDINAGLRGYGVASVVDAEGNRRDDGADEMTDVMRRACNERGIVDEEQVRRIAGGFIADCATREMGLFTRIIILKGAVAMESGVSSAEFLALINQSKEDIIAGWMLDRKVSYDSGWVRFLNDVVPGRVVPEPEIETVLQKKIEALGREEERATRRETARLIAQEAAGLSELFRARPELEVGMFGLGISTIIDAGGAQAEEAIHEQARELGVAPDVIRKYIDTLCENLRA